VHTSIVEFVKSKYYAGLKRNKDTKEIMRAIKDELGDYLNKEIGREPMIMPMYVYITRDAKSVVATKDDADAPKKE
jgi:mRNA degradation ribonuclease J1/J2